MTGASTGVTITGWREVQNVVNNLRRAGAETSEIMRAISERMQAMQLDHFEDEKDSSGKKWAPLRPMTLLRRTGSGGEKILQDHGRLIGSIASKSSKTFAAAGTNVKYAKKHQEGDEDGNVPQREFIYLTSKEKETLVKMLTDETIRKALTSRGTAWTGLPGG